MEREFTIEEKNAALEFAYSMGLTRPEKEKESIMVPANDGMLFAKAMGLRDSIINNKKRQQPAYKFA